LPIVVALIAAGAICGCGSSPRPPAIALRCAGPALAVADSPVVGPNGPQLPTPVTALGGPPERYRSAAPSLPDLLDPDDPRYGYVASGWRVSRVDTETGKRVWSIMIRPPGLAPPRHLPQRLTLEPHHGYVLAEGHVRNHSFVAAVSQTGRGGPACTLPPGIAGSGAATLLPHAGVLVISSPRDEGADGGDSYVEGYDSSSGKRIWFAPTHSSAAAGPASFVVADDDAYVWQTRDGRIAAYDVHTGDRHWTVDSHTLVPPDTGLVAAFQHRLYVLINRGTFSWLAALRGSDGKIVWERPESWFARPSNVTISELAPSRLLLSDNASATRLTTISLLAAATGRALYSMAGHIYRVETCRPASHTAVALIADGRIDVLGIDPAYDMTIRIPHGPDVAVAVAASMAYVRVARFAQPVIGYDLTTGRHIWTVTAPSSPASAHIEAVDGRFALSARPFTPFSVGFTHHPSSIANRSGPRRPR
jgi:PQQ-like domain